VSLLEAIGGAARGKVTVLLALVLGLQSADTATIGAVGAELERGLRIGNTELGLLAFLTMLSALLLSGLVMVARPSLLPARRGHRPRLRAGSRLKSARPGRGLLGGSSETR